TLATLSRLTERYGSTVVFSTATQPAFECLKTKISNYCHAGWNPHEIVPANLRMFQRAKRTKVSWPSSDNRISWIDLSARLSECEQVLCIVNLKKHARDLFELVQEEQPANTYHLSTSMCPAHRKHILNDVRQQLDNRKPCRLISTQCVEAGVDVDFPVVYRAMGPMDAIAQAAGRCNRNGRSESGDVIIFVPEVDGSLCPPGAYQQATGATEAIIKTYESRQPSIDDPKLFEKYYRKLYDLNRPGDQNTELTKAILRLDFIDVAKQYRLIDGPAINVLVPYDLDKLDRLCDELRESEKGMTRAWQAKARPYTVALYRPGAHEPFMEPVEERYGSKEISDWYIYLKDHAADYTRDLGLIPPNDNLLIA
ncbi:MAG: CRISPR-associated helicase/endonuclease Cas3, partial [Candidatus Zixiibacteriota bacterium]